MTQDTDKSIQDPEWGVITIRNRSYARPQHIAELFGVSLRTLNRWAQNRRGPPRVMIGRRALYDLEKLIAWMEANEIGPVAAKRRGRQ